MVLMSALTERKKKAAYNKWHNSEITFRGILNWRKQFTGCIVLFSLSRLTRLLVKREREKTKQNNPYLEGAMLRVVFKKRITEHFKGARKCWRAEK